MAFDYEYWVDQFMRYPRNDAEDKGVGIEQAPDAVARIIGVHALTPEENGFDSHVVLAVVDEKGKRVPGAIIGWGWEGMRSDEKANPVALDKPENEPPGNLWMGWDMTVSAWVDGMTSDGVYGLHTRHKREEPGQNRAGHWSYFVCWMLDGNVTPVVPVIPVVPVTGDLSGIVEAAERIYDDMGRFIVQVKSL